MNPVKNPFADENSSAATAMNYSSANAGSSSGNNYPTTSLEGTSIENRPLTWDTLDEPVSATLVSQSIKSLYVVSEHGHSIHALTSPHIPPT